MKTTLDYDWHTFYTNNCEILEENIKRLELIAQDKYFVEKAVIPKENLEAWLSCSLYLKNSEASNKLLDLLEVERCSNLKQRVALLMLLEATHEH